MPQDDYRWPVVPLGDLVDIYDGPHATPKKAPKGPVFLGISNQASGRLDLTQTKHVSEEDYLRWTRRITPRPNDIVFSYETRLGEAALIPKGLRACLGRRMGLLRPKSGTVDARFLLYAFLGDGFQDTLQSRTVYGSTVDRILLTELAEFPIDVPRMIEDQRAIAHILGTLDDKIELNRRMNETLEASARALFKSWFVDFDPVRAKMEGRHTGLPQDIADLFPDRLVNSEMGKIPEGWEVFRLDQLANHHTKTTSPSRFSGLEYEHFSIPAYDAGQRPAIELGAAIRSNKTVVLKDAVLLSKLNPRIARVWVPADSTARPQICSTEFLVFTPRSPANRNLLFTLFGDQRFRTLLESLVTGTSNSH